MSQLDRELSEYLETMVEGLGRSERRRALELYLTDLLLDGERKSVEPMAARMVEDEAQMEAMRQRLRQCVARSDWSNREVRRLACRCVFACREKPSSKAHRGCFRGGGRTSTSVQRSRCCWECAWYACSASSGPCAGRAPLFSSRRSTR
ncbi:transposase [Cystobacter fuscus]